MENQHRKISGYRDLTEAEVALMNRIKAHEAETMALVRDVNAHLGEQVAGMRNAAIAEQEKTGQEPDLTEMHRINNAEPARWAAIARTDFQTGFMKLVRAVAQPVSP